MKVKFKFKKEELNKQIIKSGLLIKEISSIAGIDRSTLSRILNKDMTVSRKTIANVSKALEVDAEEISEMIVY